MHISSIVGEAVPYVPQWNDRHCRGGGQPATKTPKMLGQNGDILPCKAQTNQLILGKFDCDS